MSSLVQRLCFRRMIPEILLQRKTNNAQNSPQQQPSLPQALKTIIAIAGAITGCRRVSPSALSRRSILGGNTFLLNAVLLLLISKYENGHGPVDWRMTIRESAQYII